MSSIFKPNGFVEAVTLLLKQGEGNLRRLIDAYNWARIHLKEVHRCHPGYTQKWLRDEISRVFNVNVIAYCRTAVKLGGGKSVAAMKRGYAIMNKFGVYECIRADRVLRTEDLETIRDRLTPETTLQEFRAMVDGFEDNLKRLRPTKTRAESMSAAGVARGEVTRLEQENASLRLQAQRLREENKRLKEQIARIKELMNGCMV